MYYLHFVHRCHTMFIIQRSASIQFVFFIITKCDGYNVLHKCMYSFTVGNACAINKSAIEVVGLNCIENAKWQSVTHTHTPAFSPYFHCITDFSVGTGGEEKSGIKYQLSKLDGASPIRVHFISSFYFRNLFASQAQPSITHHEHQLPESSCCGCFGVCVRYIYMLKSCYVQCRILSQMEGKTQ